MSEDHEIPEGAQDPIEELVSEFAKAWYTGKNPETNAFCKSHPEYESELRNRIEDFLFVAKRLPEPKNNVKKPDSEKTNKDEKS